MKRLLILCSLCAISATVSFAQNTEANKANIRPNQVNGPAPLIVSQSEFSNKTKALDGIIASGDKEKLQSSFDEIKKMMEGQFRMEKEQIHTATSDADKQAYTTKFHNQFAIYQQIMKMRSDLVANRTALNDKLMEFSRTIK